MSIDSNFTLNKAFFSILISSFTTKIEDIYSIYIYLMNINLWCPISESNRYSLRNAILNRARLPIPPMGLDAHCS